jgi:hypothetical protein
MMWDRSGGGAVAGVRSRLVALGAIASILGDPGGEIRLFSIALWLDAQVSQPLR